MLLVPYARRSSIGQAKNTSEGKQQSEIEAYCKAKGHVLACSLIAEIKTGTTIARQGFWRALRLLVCLTCDPGPVPIRADETYVDLQKPCGCANPRGADGVIAYDIDRLGRDARILLWLAFDFIAARGKALVILHGLDQVDTTTPEGRFHFIIMAGVAQYRRDRWIKDSWDARLIKARQRKHACGRPPFGWMRGHRSAGLVECEKEQPVLLKLEELKSNGGTYAGVAMQLDSMGHRKRNGKTWDARSVWNVIHTNTKLREWLRSGCAYNHMEVEKEPKQQKLKRQKKPIQIIEAANRFESSPKTSEQRWEESNAGKQTIPEVCIQMIQECPFEREKIEQWCVSVMDTPERTGPMQWWLNRQIEEGLSFTRIWNSLSGAKGKRRT